MMTPRQTSPLALLQERFRDDPWKVLVVCMMLNQTSAIQVKTIVDDFFNKWPTAHHLVSAEITDVKDLIRHLGFYNRRSEMLVKMSQAWLSAKWEDVLDLPGIGKYASDSFEIFCIGYLVEDVEDKELKKYIDWAHGQTA